MLLLDNSARINTLKVLLLLYLHNFELTFNGINAQIDVSHNHALQSAHIFFHKIALHI